MQLEKIIKSLLDLGLTKPIEEMVLFTDEPKFPAFVTVPNEILSKLFDTTLIFGQGLSKDKEYARLKSIAECVERICLFHSKDGSMLQEEFHNQSNFIDPSYFNCFSEEQLLNNYNTHLKNIKEAKYYWKEVTDEITGLKKFIPAQLVYLSEMFKNEILIREQISTGTAIYTNKNQALISGTLEVLERDAYMTAYLNKKEIKKINNDNKEIKELIDYLNRYELYPHIFDITNDLAVPSVMTITLDYTGIGPAVNVGLRSDFCYKNAIIGSLMESIQCRRITRLMKETNPNKIITEDDVNDLSNRYLYWYDVSKIKDLEFWLSTNNTISLSKLEEKNIDQEMGFNYIKNKLSNLGYNIFSADITWDEVRNAGFNVSKIIIPELQPLYLNEKLKCLYSKHGGNIRDDSTLKPHPFT